MPVNKRDVVRVIKAGASDEAQKNSLLVLAGLEPGLWDGLDEEEVLGVLKYVLKQRGVGANFQPASAVTDAALVHLEPLLKGMHISK